MVRIPPSASMRSFGAYGPEARSRSAPLGVAGLSHLLHQHSHHRPTRDRVLSYARRSRRIRRAGGPTPWQERTSAPSLAFGGRRLMIDYLLNVAVGYRRRRRPRLCRARLTAPYAGLCLVILAVLTLVTLRGVREPGVVFMTPPTSLCLLARGDRLGRVSDMHHGRSPAPCDCPPPLPPA